jgi:hypothetical protein
MGKGGASGATTEVVIQRGGDASVLTTGAIKVYDTAGGGGVTGSVVMLTDLDGALTGAASAEHTAIDTSSARKFGLGGNITKTGSPTDLVIEARMATNTSTTLRLPMRNWFWGDLRWDDTVVGASGLDFYLEGDVSAPAMSVFATMTGSNTFTLSNMFMVLKD